MRLLSFLRPSYERKRTGTKPMPSTLLVRSGRRMAKTRGKDDLLKKRHVKLGDTWTTGFQGGVNQSQ